MRKKKWAMTQRTSHGPGSVDCVYVKWDSGSLTILWITLCGGERLEQI
jgi:hypothetical protein